jgi:hypothetical protein
MVLQIVFAISFKKAEWKYDGILSIEKLRLRLYSWKIQMFA